VEEKLSLRRKQGGRRRRAGARVLLLPPPSEPDQFWTMDFATDAFASGQRFRTLNLMDGFDREALEIEVDTSLGGVRGGCGRSQSGHTRIYQCRIGKAREREMIVQHEHPVLAFDSISADWPARRQAPWRRAELRIKAKKLPVFNEYSALAQYCGDSSV
jgi:hypothetical protein